jgi:hypothetical protein
MMIYSKFVVVGSTIRVKDMFMIDIPFKYCQGRTGASSIMHMILLYM